MISDQLRDELLAFRKERDWEQFHNLRTLSTSIALEAAELMEHTQWAKDAELPTLATEHRDALAQEIATLLSCSLTWPTTYVWTLKPPCARSW